MLREPDPHRRVVEAAVSAALGPQVDQLERQERELSELAAQRDAFFRRHPPSRVRR